MQNIYPDAGVWNDWPAISWAQLGSFEVNWSLLYIVLTICKLLYRSVISSYFLTYEAHLLSKCKANRLQHHQFWAAGVNDIWAVDQHDKWLQFGLALHTGIEPFSGCILWVKVWHSNWNPQLILSYYLETVESFGRKCLTCMLFSLLTCLHTARHPYGDSEWPWNRKVWDHQCADLTVANAQSDTWRLCPTPMDAHQEEHHAGNCMVTAPTSFSPGFERLLDSGLDAGWYDPDNTLQLWVW